MDSMINTLLTILSSLSAFLVLIYYYHHRFRKPNHDTRNKKLQLPRAKGALPIIGHLHQLTGSNQLIHKTLGRMADKYGPVFTIRLGSQENMVVSSWETAKECFTTLDKIFSDRPKVAASRILGYNYSMFGLAPYGPYWREMRRIATLELLSHRRIDMVHHIRASEVETSLKEMYHLWAAKQGLNGAGSTVVDMKQWFADITLNTFVQMVGGKRFVQGGEEEAMERSYMKVMREFMYFFGVFVLSDAIPWLGWLDVSGCEKRMKRIAKELDALISKWLEEHIERRMRMRITGEERVDRDFMDVMLTIMEDVHFPQFDAHTITKSTCLNMILAGSDSTMVTLTWALSLLLNNPHALRKAQEEVDSFVSKDRHVKESDINKLVYLDAVVKETLRLYPASPIIGFHSSMEDCTISPGYHVPSGTRLLVNIWKIQRDGDLWPEPLEFRPERFLTSHKDVDVRGKSFEFMPFGSGRRGCPGTALALRTVHLTLASLLHCYEFSRPDDAEIDMTESPGLTNLKATPLEVCISPRLSPQVFGVGLHNVEI